jgi:V/A-type H+-transporting ATPase subunit A
MSMERQQISFRLLKGLIEADYRFSDKDAARNFFIKITGAYKNLNYSQEESQEYQRYQKEIEDLAAEYSISD